MNVSFELSEKLRLYLQVACNYKSLTLGVRCPVSIRRRYSMSQTIVIYPESGYNFFSSREVMCYVSLANGLGLDSYVEVENGVPVITVCDYIVKSK